MENNNNPPAGSGQDKFLNGFLLGALIGGGIVLLLNSKKGKKILKAISEEGLDNISEFIDQQDQAEEDLDEEEAQEPNVNASPAPQSEDKKPLVRRFFRGITRKP